MSLYYMSLNVQSKCNEAIMISTVDCMFLLQGSFLCHFPASAGNVLTFCYVTPDFLLDGFGEVQKQYFTSLYSAGDIFCLFPPTCCMFA